MREEPDDDIREEWAQEIEDWLRFTMGDIVTPEGADLAIRYKYIPNSSRIEKILYEELEGEYYLDRIVVSYQAEIWELGDLINGTMKRPIYPHGLLTITLDETHHLIWDELDAIEGIHSALAGVQ